MQGESATHPPRHPGVRPPAAGPGLPRPGGDADALTSAERAAALLRQAITGGELVPGEALREQDLAPRLGVSRNTLREAFRLLAHDGLVVHRRHRGVEVKRLTRADVAELFRARRAIEGAGIRSAPDATDSLARLERDVATLERAASRGRWPEVAAANLAFHGGLAALVGSPRLDAFFVTVLAELRLASGPEDALEPLHAPFVPANRNLAELVLARDVDRAIAALDDYLDHSQRLLMRRRGR